MTTSKASQLSITEMEKRQLEIDEGYQKTYKKKYWQRCLKRVNRRLAMGLGFEHLIQEGGSTSLVETLPSPRLLPTHLAFSLFPNSMASGACRFVYICRNPKDAFVSLWHFFNKLRSLKQVPPLSLEDALDSFSKGVSFCGPFWDHVLGIGKPVWSHPTRFCS
ncbi:hypothetical protein COLO4_27329 [Corchorus olitorius]|uniref:Sulfotransferase n=1 Tax=Corchorus olitorius TaxID=93759 RepID=A0A1R3HRP8_9ROSI|nr:hypothetical protein COLO4_27329 [Corchorus olitorius]